MVEGIIMEPDSRLRLEENCDCAPWEDYEGKAHNTPWPECGDCGGTGKRPTKFGQELLAFIKKYFDIGNSVR
jgi:hypothetical protein